MASGSITSDEKWAGLQECYHTLSGEVLEKYHTPLPTIGAIGSAAYARVTNIRPAGGFPAGPLEQTEKVQSHRKMVWNFYQQRLKDWVLMQEVQLSFVP